VERGENKPLGDVAPYGCYTNVSGTGRRGEAVLNPVHLAVAPNKVRRYLRAEPSSMPAFTRRSRDPRIRRTQAMRHGDCRVAYTGKTVLGSTRQARGLSTSACNVSAVDKWKRVRIDNVEETNM
jgi:hypothetical protein